MIKRKGNITITCSSKDFTNKGLFLMIDDEVSHQKVALEWKELLDIADLVHLLRGFEIFNKSKD